MDSFKTAMSLLLGAAICLSAGCTRRVEKTEKAEEHERWRTSLNDSISDLQESVSNTELSLDEATGRVSDLLLDFEHVNNPREVEGYIIMKGWRNRYPLSSTGVVARITEGEGLEVVAVLTKGVFDQIRVSAAGASVESAVVPHDQALNYRSAGLNTVAFQGAQADSVARFIHTHLSAAPELTFLNNGAVTGKVKLQGSACNMVSRTWELYAARKEVERLERALPIYTGKIRALRQMIEKSSHPESSPSPR